MMRPLLAIAPMLLAGWFAAPAAGQAKRLQEPWRWTHFGVESGLPSMDVLHVSESGDGTIWVGLPDSVAWFDGYRWNPLPLPPPDSRDVFLGMEPGPGDSVVLKIGHQGIYLASPRGLVPVPLDDYDDRLVMNLATVTGDRLVLSSLPNSKRDQNALMVIRENGRFEPFPLPPGVVPRERFRIRPDHRGGLWLWTRTMIQHWTAEGWEKPLAFAGEGMRILSLVGGFDDEVWAWLVDERRDHEPGLYIIDTEGTRRHSRNVDHFVVRASAQAPDGRILIVFNTGELNLIDAEGSRRLDIMPLALRSVRDLHFDRSGNLWAATARGVQLCRYSSDLWTRWIHPRPSSRNEVYTAQQGPDGSLWIATRDALEEHRPDGEVIFHGGEGRPGPRHLSTFDFAEDGTLWAGGYQTGGGAWRYDGRDWELVGAAGGLSDAVLGRVDRDHAGRIWLLFTTPIEKNSRFHEAYHLAGGQIEKWAPGEELVGQIVRDLDGAGPDDLWFATHRGVARFDHGRWRYWDTESGLLSNSTTSVAVDPRGRCWYGVPRNTPGCIDPALGVVETGEWPAEMNRVGRMERAPDGTIWVSTDDALVFFSNGSWRTIRSGPGWEDQTILGLRATNEFVHLSTRYHGLVRLSVAECTEPAPRIEIGEPAVGEGFVTTQWAAYPFMGAEYELGGTTRFAVDGGEWSEWSDREETTLTDLAPGRHQFAVQARGRFGEWNSETSIRSFEIPMPIFRQPLFLIPIAGLSAILFAVLVMFVLRGRQDARVLLESRNRFQTLAEVSPTGIFRTDARGVITYVNHRTEEITGRSGEELRGDGWAEALHPEDSDRILAAWGEAVREKKSFRAEHRFRRPDGTSTWVILDAVPERDASDAVVGFIGTATEVTERKELEQQLRTAQRLDSVGQLAGGVAHDFNNLLQVILGSGQLALDEAESPGVVENLREITSTAQRASDLARQLLAFSRQETGAPAPLDVNGVVRGLSALLRRLLPESIEIELELSEGIGVVMADAGQLEQVLINLCVNARDALIDGGHLTIRSEQAELDGSFERTHPWIEAGSFIRLSVVDDGIGIPRDIIDRIFDPFFTTKEPGKGTGLGLATSYGIVKQHCGVIQVSSRPGKGSTFDIYLPLADEGLPAPEAPPSPGASGGAETILVAEDEELVRQLARKVLEKAGYTVIEAVDGDAAIAALLEEGLAVDLVLLDVVMPGRSGRAVYDEVTPRRPGLRVLFTSGYSEAALPREFLREHGLEVLAKPYRTQELLEAVRRMLDGGAPGPGDSISSS